MYSTLKLVHVAAVFISIGGFALRGWWMIRSPERLTARWVRIAPHVVDTALLLTGVSLAVILGLQPGNQPWLLAKLVALVVYIVLGSIALKRGPTLAIRSVALVFALLTFAYILGAAFHRSPASWFA